MGEPRSKYLRRGHCDNECSRQNPERRRKQSERFQKARADLPKRTCVACKGSFSIGDYESASRFLERDTCSRECAAKKRSMDREEEALKNGKVCANPKCGKTFYRRVKGESLPRFEKRKTCSTDCGHISRRIDPDSLAKAPKPKQKKEPQTKKEREDEKYAVESTLPPVEPTKIVIPDPPKPKYERVWRPQSWGGEFLRRIS